MLQACSCESLMSEPMSSEPAIPDELLEVFRAAQREAVLRSGSPDGPTITADEYDRAGLAAVLARLPGPGDWRVIEAAAKAIADVNTSYPWDQMSLHTMDRYRDMARAALSAGVASAPAAQPANDDVKPPKVTADDLLGIFKHEDWCRYHDRLGCASQPRMEPNYNPWGGSGTAQDTTEQP